MISVEYNANNVHVDPNVASLLRPVATKFCAWFVARYLRGIRVCQDSLHPPFYCRNAINWF